MSDSDAPGIKPRQAMLRWLLPVCLALALISAVLAMKTALESAHQALTISFNLGVSQALVTHLTEGAAADVFFGQYRSRSDDRCQGDRGSSLASR